MRQILKADKAAGRDTPGNARQIKQKAPAQEAGAKYRGLSRTEHGEPTRGTRAPPPRRQRAGSTPKAYAPPRSAQAAFSWLCALADSVGHHTK
jgi:hypothetical protein